MSCAPAPIKKCLAETEEIITAAFEEIGNSDTDAVMIAGDLTMTVSAYAMRNFGNWTRGLAQKKPIVPDYRHT